MPRGPNPQTRCAILDVALSLFTRQGYDRTSLREIAANLGFSKAALYYHFPAKQDILHALADDLLDAVDEITQSALAAPDRSLAARTALLERLMDLLMTNRATALLLLSEGHSLDPAGLGQRLNDALAQARESLLPDHPTVEDRIRAAAALAILQSALHNLSDSPADALRGTVLRLAVGALGHGDETRHS